MTSKHSVPTAFVLPSKWCLLVASLYGICSVVHGHENVLDICSPHIPIEPFTYSVTTTPEQIPLCMVGDSITWAQQGDVWRKVLLEHLPRLAFVGTHSAKLGYSHAGEGGNNVAEVLARLEAIPDCPYYSLHIGTNSNNVKDAAQVQARAAKTAKQISDLVVGLLKKKSVKKVFLCSIIPCDTKNPLRDETNSATNVLLRGMMGTSLPRDQVVWVELEKPIRSTENWRPIIRLHPTPAGYRLLAKILAARLVQSLGIEDAATIPVPEPNAGVGVHNLWETKNDRTTEPVIPGWYVVSFDLKKHVVSEPSLTISSFNSQTVPLLQKNFDLASGMQEDRVVVRFFTGYEGYGYTRDHLTLRPKNCEIDRILFEKRRPSGQPSRYGEGSYFETTSLPSPGELIEAK